jgi:hypothetical protein
MLTSTINDRLSQTIEKTLSNAGLHVSTPTHYTKRCDEYGIDSVRESEDVKDRPNTRLSFWLKNETNGVYGYREGDIFVNVGRDTKVFSIVTNTFANCIETHEHMNTAKEVQLRFRADDTNKGRQAFVAFLFAVVDVYKANAVKDVTQGTQDIQNVDEVAI